MTTTPYDFDQGLILLVEDNPDDILLTRRAVKKAEIPLQLHVVTDGEQAIDYLSRAKAVIGSEGNRTPSIILLDLKLPKKTGIEVLQWIRGQAVFTSLPVIMLTTSAEEEDILTAYQSGANSYLQKPIAFQSLVTMLDSVNNYWLRTNTTLQTFAVN